MRLVPRSSDTLFNGALELARKTNYDFERREREKNKGAEAARKAKAKADRKSEQGAADVTDADAGTEAGEA